MVPDTVAIVTQDGRMIVVCEWINCPNTTLSAFSYASTVDSTLAVIQYEICKNIFFYLLKGLLKGFDQTINLILDESHERVFSSTNGVEQVVLGLYIIRGDNM